MTFLCLASYFKGNRFLERLKAEGCTVYLLTVESVLGEPWTRHAGGVLEPEHAIDDRFEPMAGQA